MARRSKEQIDAAEREVARQEITAVSVSYSGPLPHPSIMEHYNNIIPGGAERIFAVFESQTRHRQSIERWVIWGNVFCQIFGAIAAAALGVIALGGGLYLVYLGRSITGFAAFFGGLGGLVSVYIYGKKSQADERNQIKAKKGRAG